MINRALITLLAVLTVGMVADSISITISKVGTNYVKLTATNTVPHKPYTLLVKQGVDNPNWILDSTLSTKTNYLSWVLPIQKSTNVFFQLRD